MTVVEPRIYAEDHCGHETGADNQSCEEYGFHFAHLLRRVPRRWGGNLHNQCKDVNTESVRGKRKV